MDYCSKHNRKMLISKFPNPKTGEKQYWCPDCYAENKEKSAGKGNKDEQILEELAKINKRLDGLATYLAEEFKGLAQIFGEK